VVKLAFVLLATVRGNAVKRWAGLFALFLLAAIGVMVFAPRFQPSELERRHATINLGMTRDEVAKITDSLCTPAIASVMMSP
jgi:hypothetical protein